MKSDYIKACLSAYYRFGKGHHAIATEAGRFSADFLTADKKGVCTEVEIKTSKSDLNNDFKKNKHQMYATARSKYVPNYFYFAVPKEILEYAVAKCVDKPYGVMVVKPHEGKIKNTWRAKDEEHLKKKILPMLRQRFKGFELVKAVKDDYGVWIDFTYYGLMDWQSRVKVIKRAKRLHDKKVDPATLSNIIQRLSSEMANLRIISENEKEKANDSKKEDTKKSDEENTDAN